MSLQARIESDFVQAYKAKDQLKVAVLRMLKTAVKNRQVELVKPLEPLTDESVLDIILKQAKQRQESIEQYRNAGRAGLLDRNGRTGRSRILSALTTRYERDTRISVTQSDASMLFMTDSPAWNKAATIRTPPSTCSRKILLDRQHGKAPRVLLSLATGAGKTIIATNLLSGWGRLANWPSPPCFCATAMNCAARPMPSSRPLLATMRAS